MIDIPSLITVWLQVRVLPGPPVDQHLASPHFVLRARGEEIVDPLLRIARDAASEAMRLGTEFGLTLASGARLRGVGRHPPSKFGDPDPIG